MDNKPDIQKTVIDRQITIMTLVQWVGLLSFCVAAMAIYMFWNDPNRLMVAGVLIFVGCADYFVMRMLILRLQEKRTQL